MSERLEEIKLAPKYPANKESLGIVKIYKEDFQWLVEQTEAGNEWSKQLGELNEFLQKRADLINLGRPVAYVAMEHIKELENDYEYLSHHYGLETEQNKRYQEKIQDIKQLCQDFRDERIGEITDSFLVDEIIAVLEEDKS